MTKPDLTVDAMIRLSRMDTLHWVMLNHDKFCQFGCWFDNYEIVIWRQLRGLTANFSLSCFPFGSCLEWQCSERCWDVCNPENPYHGDCISGNPAIASLFIAALESRDRAISKKCEGLAPFKTFDPYAIEIGDESFSDRKFTAANK